MQHEKYEKNLKELQREIKIKKRLLIRKYGVRVSRYWEKYLL
jgi:hypothetical protein